VFGNYMFVLVSMIIIEKSLAKVTIELNVIKF